MPAKGGKRKPEGKRPAPARRESSAGPEFPLTMLERTGHVRTCLLCKELLDQAVDAEDDYVDAARQVIVAHMKSKAKNQHESIKCEYAGCLHHEDVPRELAMAMIRIGDGDEIWRDDRKVPVSTISFAVTEKDCPKGFEKGDAQLLYFKELKKAAGMVYVRLAPKRVTVHVWVLPAYSTKHESIEDPATLENVLNVFEKVVPGQREWLMAKYRALKELAQMDAEFGGGKEGAE